MTEIAKFALPPKLSVPSTTTADLVVTLVSYRHASVTRVDTCRIFSLESIESIEQNLSRVESAPDPVSNPVLASGYSYIILL